MKTILRIQKLELQVESDNDSMPESETSDCFYRYRGKNYPIPEEVMKLADLWNRGLTGEQIAKELGERRYDVVTTVSNLRHALPALFPYRRADANSRVMQQSNGK